MEVDECSPVLERSVDGEGFLLMLFTGHYTCSLRSASHAFAKLKARLSRESGPWRNRSEFILCPASFQLMRGAAKEEKEPGLTDAANLTNDLQERRAFIH